MLLYLSFWWVALLYMSIQLWLSLLMLTTEVFFCLLQTKGCCTKDVTKIQNTFDLQKKLPLSNSSNSTSCRTNSDKSNPCQDFSFWVSPFTVMDCYSWVMICQSQEILIFPELHQVMPYCHCLCEILMAIIYYCWWQQWDCWCPCDLDDILLHHIL